MDKGILVLFTALFVLGTGANLCSLGWHESFEGRVWATVGTLITLVGYLGAMAVGLTR